MEQALNRDGEILRPVIFIHKYILARDSTLGPVPVGIRQGASFDLVAGGLPPGLYAGDVFGGLLTKADERPLHLAGGCQLLRGGPHSEG